MSVGTGHSDGAFGSPGSIGDAIPSNDTQPPPSMRSPTMGCPSPKTQMMPPPSPNTTKLLNSVLKGSKPADSLLSRSASATGLEQDVAGVGEQNANFSLDFGDQAGDGDTFLNERCLVQEQAVRFSAPATAAPPTPKSSTMAMAQRPAANSAMPGACDHFENIFKDVSDKHFQLMGKWVEILGESELFELMCPVRLDAMLAEARAVEQDLAQQKEKIVSRLQLMHKALQQSWEI